MAYVPPTVDDIFARFPELAAADEYLVAFCLEEAIGQVDDSWLEKDYKPAIQYLTAHLVTMQSGAMGGVFTPPAAGSGGAGGTVKSGPITSESFGPISTTYANLSSTSSGGGGSGKGSIYADQDLVMTVYGRQYMFLRSKNFPAIVVA